MSNLIYVSLLFVCFLVMLSVSFKLDDSWDGSEEYPAAVAQRRPAELKPPTADDESKKSNMGKGRAYTKKLGPRVRSLRVYPVTPKRIIRVSKCPEHKNRIRFLELRGRCGALFSERSAGALPALWVLRRVEAGAEWVGVSFRIIVSRNNENIFSCGIGTGFDCTEEYKLTRFRKAESSYPWWWSRSWSLFF